MIIPDANILIYAYDTASPQHAAAKRWRESVLSGTGPIGIPWVVMLAFTRILTHPALCENPLSTEQVRKIVEQWLAHPHLRLLNPAEGSLGPFYDLLQEAGMGGNLITGAVIALHTRQHGATLYSNDRDFDRFSGIRRVNPAG